MPRSTWRTGGSFELLIEGKDDLVKRYLQESGGHRWQRIPPTEKRGRVHTSTVTVAVFEVPPERAWSLKDRDIETYTTRDSGPGGQHRNCTDSCVVMRHLPTGIEAKAAAKCQHTNRRTARAMLEARVFEFYESKKRTKESADRKSKVGSGMRGDKIRTYREQDDVVIDHVLETKARLKDVRAGRLEVLKK